MVKEGKLVICKVKEVHSNSVDVEILEEGKQGIIPITEISRAWIRDVKKFIKKGDLVVGRVISTKGAFITLSLRKVSDFEKEKKLKEYRKEIAAKKIIENMCKEAKVNFSKIEKVLMENFGSLANALEEARKDFEDFEKLQLPKSFLELLHRRVCKEGRKYEIKGFLEVHTFDGEGIKKIKDLLSSLKNIEVVYISPKFLVSYCTNDAKKGKRYLKERMEEVLKKAKEFGGFGNFEFLEN